MIKKGYKLHGYPLEILDATSRIEIKKGYKLHDNPLLASLGSIVFKKQKRLHITTMFFELTNEQREYFGLDPVLPHWERVALEKNYIVYFDGDIIKKSVSCAGEHSYIEEQYDEQTREKRILLPKTAKGKEKKLTASAFSARKPHGMYINIQSARIIIGNHNTQTTLFDTLWEGSAAANSVKESIPDIVDDYIKTSPPQYLSQLHTFKNARRQHVKFKPGDFFTFPINRTEYGFGRVLLDVYALKQQKWFDQYHGMSFLMSRPVLVKLYAHIADDPEVDIEMLHNKPVLPSDYMMDNHLFYGEYRIIGRKPLLVEDLDLPVSYGRHIAYGRGSVFLQWGLIHRELPLSSFSGYTMADNPFNPDGYPMANPYGYYGVAFSPRYNGADIKNVIRNNGVYDFKKDHYNAVFDLRNPANLQIRKEIMKAFGLDPQKGYAENCVLTGTTSAHNLLQFING